MPSVPLPSFFGESFRASSFQDARQPDISEPPELDERSELRDAVSLTPFAPKAPALLPDGRRHADTGEPSVLSGPTAGPTNLSAQTVLRSGTLRKKSKHLSVWQQRFVVLEGAPTNLLVYYGSSAATAAEDASVKPRGVVALVVRLSPNNAPSREHRGRR